MPEPIFLKLDMCNMAAESISTAHFINPSHQSVCPHVCPFIVARKLLGVHVPEAKNTCNNKIILRITGFLDFYIVQYSRN
jgi:hypothetical protein